jgi:hypothetical protein
MGRPDLERLEPGVLYRHSYTDDVLQFLGVATMPELDGEEVGVFRFMEGGRFFIATMRGHARGERFIRVTEDVEVDEATTAEWRAFVEGDEP